MVCSEKGSHAGLELTMLAGFDFLILPATTYQVIELLTRRKDFLEQEENLWVRVELIC